ncbi:MAG: CaiB/BaiF CoA transferase family protein [Halobacteriaceae archaeon]
MPQALDGVRVADFTQLMQGGWAAQKLGDMGADVVKIEPPHGEPGRYYRAAGRFHEGVSPFFLSMNRNKRSVPLDLKTEEGRQTALDVIAEADVLMENFRPDVMDRLGLSYEDVQEVNEDIVYVSASAYGSSGPYADRPGQDLLYQAMTGLTSYTGRAGDPPTPAGTVVVDEHSATSIALSVMFALFYRERTGEGQKLEASLLDSAVDFQCQEATVALNMDVDVEPGRKTHGHPLLWPPYGVYEAADGSVAVGMADLQVVGEALGVPGLEEYDTEREQFEHRDEIHDAIEAATRDRPAADVVADLVAADVQAVETATVAEMADDPQIQHNDMLIEVEHPNGGTYTTTGSPVTFSETPMEVRHRPPRLGEHGEEVLREIGYSAAEVEELVASGALGRDEE